jgi:hypothetical protein
MRLVKFKNGRYGINKRTYLDRILGREGKFYDFNPTGFCFLEKRWMSSSDEFFIDCQVSSREIAEETFDKLRKKVILVEL